MTADAPKPKRGKWLLIAAFAVGSALVIAAAGLWLWAGPAIRARIVHEALQRGIEIDFDDYHAKLGELRLEGVRFRLLGVRGVAGTIDEVTIALDGFDPTGIDLSALELTVVGSVPGVALELTEWTKNYPSAYALRLTGKPVAVQWRSALDAPPWLLIEQGELERVDNVGLFKAKQAQVSGLVVGPVGTAWTKQSAQVMLGFGEAKLEDAPITASVSLEGEHPTAQLELRPTPAKKLSGPLGVELPLKENVIISADANLHFDSATATGPVTGSFALELENFVPPHPRELDGFVFGDTTTVRADLGINAERTLVELDNVRVLAGAFQLKGSGEVRRYPDHARLRLKLNGNLPCNELAGAAAESYLGQELGKFVGKLARENIKGGVGVIVNIDADSRYLDDAKVLKTIGLGCGLKPLPLPDPSLLDEFKEQLPSIDGKLPDLPKDLDTLPSALPPMPKFELPKFPAPTRPKPTKPPPPTTSAG